MTWLLALGATLLLAGPVAAEDAAPETVEVGGMLAAVTLEDQHGEAHAVDASVRVILFSREMDSGRLLREMLEPENLREAPTGFLARLAAVRVADVHRMPAVIRGTIAKPRMRKRPYPILLDEKGDATAAWPSREGQATVIRLEALRVVEVRHYDSAASLREALD